MKHKRGFKTGVKAGVIAAACSLMTLQTVMPAAANSTGIDPLKIRLISDTHYFSNALYSDCPDFTNAENSDRKMLKESDAILNSVLKNVFEDKPDVVLISGDLTKDGEKINHQALADKLKATQDALKQQGTDTKFFVINGNHDINNPHALDFSSGTAVDAKRTGVDDFKSIYKAFGYGSDTEQFKENSTQGGSLSYVTQLAEGYTLISVDTGKYSYDQTDSGTDIQETGGVIGQELLDWVTSKAKEAKQNGDVVMVMQHHGVVPHFDQEPVVMADYLVDNYKQVQEAYADAGVNYVFTGHMHANDVAAYTSPKGNTLYDIETGSILTYPSYTRDAIVTKGTFENGLSSSMQLKTIETRDVAYTDPATNQTQLIPDLKAYGKDRTLSFTVIKTMINSGLVDPLVDDILAQGGTKEFLNHLLNRTDISIDLVNTLTNQLPQSKENGIDLSIAGFQFKVYYDADERQIRISQADSAVFANGVRDEKILIKTTKKQYEITPSPQWTQTFLTAMTAPRGLFDPIELNIKDAKLIDFLNALFVDMDTQIVSNKAALHQIVNTAIDSLLNTPINASHSVFDFIDYVYQTHLAGDEACAPWAEAAIRKIKDENFLSQALKQTIVDTQPILQQTLAAVSIDLTSLIDKGNNSALTATAHSLLADLIQNAGDIVGMIDISTLVPDNLYDQMNALALNVADSMVHDRNYAQDNHTTISIPRTLTELKNDADNALADASAITQGQYSDASYQNLQTAIRNLEIALQSNDHNAISNALTELKNAKNNLKTESDVLPTDTTTSVSVNTEDTTNVTALIIIAILSAAGLLSAVKKRFTQSS